MVEKLKIAFFVTVALATFSVLGVLYIVMGLLARPATAPADGQTTADFRQNDPLLTKKPGLKDLIKAPLITADDPSVGADRPAVNLVIFSDFTCRFCADQEKILKSVLSLYPDKVRLIRKDYPEGDAASASWQAALAGRCAAGQDRFWQMDELLYQARDWSADGLQKLARAGGLDPASFKNCLEEKIYQKAIEDNITEANTLDISGVPFIFVNNREFLGEASFEELKAAVEKELKK